MAEDGEESVQLPRLDSGGRRVSIADSRPAVREQIKAIDEILRNNQVGKGERELLSVLQQFLLYQWLPHLDSVHERVQRFDRMYDTFERINIWLDGACWIIRRGLPGLIIIGTVAYGTGRYGSKLGLW